MSNLLRGDFDSDGIVGFTDFSAFADQFNKSIANDAETFISSFDLVADGEINDLDFSVAGMGANAVAVEGMPTTDIGFALGYEVDETTATYHVTVSIDKAEALKGFQFEMTYDHNVLEFMEDNVTGLVGLNVYDTKDGVIRVASEFVGEKFLGDVTLGFKTKGIDKDITIEIVNGMVDNLEGVALSTNLGEVSLRAIPAVYSLSPNYPNPFNPTTTIDYSIPKSGNVELVIFNLAGQKVRTLVNEHRTAAFYKVVWDGRNNNGESVGSGLYFYRIQSGSFSKIEKMTLVK